MTKSKKRLSDLMNNNKIVFVISFLLAITIWLAVVINVSPETERTISNVKVTIDNTIPAQFGLEVFGDTEFYVDVKIKGKKYQISSSAVSAEDIVVVAQTTNVDSAGKRTLVLKAEPISENADYTISEISQRSIDVYFDIPKTIQMVIEPQVIATGFEIVKEGFTLGDINLSKTTVNISGPSTEVNKISKVTAQLELDTSLESNKSADAQLVIFDENNDTNFKYLKTDIDSVVLTIPVLRVKEVGTTVLFKNAPDEYVLNPLKYTISPARDYFNISVDEYDKATEFPLGTIDFKSVSPTNYVFEFLRSDLPVADNSSTEKYVVKLDVSNLTQDYFTVSTNKIKVNNPDDISYKISGLNKSVVVVGSEKALESITEDDISVEIDLSDVVLVSGQTTSVPANVTVNSSNCWVYGTYTVEISV